MEQQCLRQVEGFAHDFGVAPKSLRCTVVHAEGHIRITAVERVGQMEGVRFDCNFDERGKFQDLTRYQ